MICVMSMVGSRTERFRRLPTFEQVDAETVARLERVATGRAYRSGHWLWHAGDRGDCITVIDSGLVEISRSAPNGDRSVLGLFGPQEPVGLVAVLDGEPYPADACVLSAHAFVFRIPVAEVHAAAFEDPRFGAALRRDLTAHSHALLAKIDVVAAGSVAARLATLLAYLAERFGRHVDERRVVLTLPLTRLTLASTIDARVETVIRIMSSWKKSGIVRAARGVMDLDPKAIAEIAARG